MFMKKIKHRPFHLQNLNFMGFARLSLCICFSLWICSCILNLEEDYSDFLTLASLSDEISPADSHWFYIDMDESAYDTSRRKNLMYEISTTEEFGDTRSSRKRSSGARSRSNCEVEHRPDDHPADNATKDIYCILDIMEHDFFLRDLVIKYNIPTGMCHSVITRVPWHFNQIVGKGPERLYECSVTTETSLKDDGCDETKENRYYRNGCPARQECTITRPLGTEKVEDFCAKFDRTEQDLGNCCFGEYTLHKEDGNVENKKWSSDLKDCIGGPGRTSWDAYDDKYGIPIHHIEETFTVLEGYNVKYTFKSPHSSAKNQYFSSAPVANYIESLDTKANEVPRQVERLLSQTGSLVGVPEGLELFRPYFFFSVECKDAAGETPHALHLMIREWNTYEEFYDYYLDGGAKGYNPDVAGEEGGKCDYETDRLASQYNSEDCNDFADLDDYLDFPAELGFPHLLYK